MRIIISALVAIIVVLAALLVREVKQRRAAENLVAAIGARSVSNVRHDDSGAVQGNSATLSGLVSENRRLRAQLDASAPQSTDRMSGKVAILRDVLARLSDQSIPELALATEGDWYAAVGGDLETVDDYRVALSKLRDAAQLRFAEKARLALAAYLGAHDGKFPTDVSQLAPHFASPMDAAIFQRYKIAPASEFKNVRVGGDWVITQTTLVDSEYDSRSVIGPWGHGTFSKTKKG